MLFLVTFVVESIRERTPYFCVLQRTVPRVVINMTIKTLERKDFCSQALTAFRGLIELLDITEKPGSYL